MNRRTFLRTVGAAGVATVGATGTASALGRTVHEVTVVADDDGAHFDPIGLYVAPGDTVRWTVESGVQTVTAYGVGETPRRIPEDAATWDSGTLRAGETVEQTFTEPGTYDYFSAPHRTDGAVGRIVCWWSGGPATESPIPTQPARGTMPSSNAIMNRMELEYPYEGPVPDGLGVAWKAVAAFGATGLGAVGAYHVVSSEGEDARVGSAAWRREHGIDDRRG